MKDFLTKIDKSLINSVILVYTPQNKREFPSRITAVKRAEFKQKKQDF